MPTVFTRDGQRRLVDQLDAGALGAQPYAPPYGESRMDDPMRADRTIRTWAIAAILLGLAASAAHAQPVA